VERHLHLPTRFYGVQLSYTQGQFRFIYHLRLDTSTSFTFTSFCQQVSGISQVSLRATWSTVFIVRDFSRITLNRTNCRSLNIWSADLLFTNIKIWLALIFFFQTHARTRLHTHTRTHALAHTNTRTHALAHTHMHARACTHTNTRARAHAQACTHTQKHTHARTHIGNRK